MGLAENPHLSSTFWVCKNTLNHHVPHPAPLASVRRRWGPPKGHRVPLYCLLRGSGLRYPSDITMRGTGCPPQRTAWKAPTRILSRVTHKAHFHTKAGDVVGDYSTEWTHLPVLSLRNMQVGCQPAQAPLSCWWGAKVLGEDWTLKFIPVGWLPAQRPSRAPLASGRQPVPLQCPRPPRPASAGRWFPPLTLTPMFPGLPFHQEPPDYCLTVNLATVDVTGIRC